MAKVLDVLFTTVMCCFCAVEKRPWSFEEKSVVNEHFGHYYVKDGLPGKDEITSCLSNPALQNRTWKNVKDFVRNMQLSKSKCYIA